MANEMTRPQRGAARVSLTLLITLIAGLLLSISSPAQADVTAVSGSARGYISDVSLFGGPKQREGAGQVACTSGLGNPPDCTTADLASSSSPSVTLPAAGGDLSDSKDAGATAQYGPAKLFSGQYPNATNDPSGGATSPPSGPINVHSSGTTGPNGSVTSTAEIQQGTQGTADPNQPRGIGPGPLVADAVSATCTASETNSATGAKDVTGSVHITNGVLVTSTDNDGNAKTTVPIPSDPSANDSGHTGTITNVGDNFTVTYNEQTTANGVLTVWALHMQLLGPTAVGDLWIGGVTCGLTTVPGTSTQGTTATTQGSTSTTSGSTSTTQATTSTTQGGTSTTQASTSTTRASTSTTQAATSTTQATSTTSTPGSPPGRIVPTVVCDILAALSRLPIVGPLIAFVARLLGCGAG